MMEETNNRPSAERILSLLVELLADQHKVKVRYQIIKNGDDFGQPARELAGMEEGIAV